MYLVRNNNINNKRNSKPHWKQQRMEINLKFMQLKIYYTCLSIAFRFIANAAEVVSFLFSLWGNWKSKWFLSCTINCTVFILSDFLRVRQWQIAIKTNLRLTLIWALIFHKSQLSIKPCLDYLDSFLTIFGGNYVCVMGCFNINPCKKNEWVWDHFSSRSSFIYCSQAQSNLDNFNKQWTKGYRS